MRKISEAQIFNHLNLKQHHQELKVHTEKHTKISFHISNKKKEQDNYSCQKKNFHMVDQTGQVPQ